LRLTLTACVLLLSAGFSGTATPAEGGAQAEPEPWALLRNRCEKCHNSEDWAGGVAFDTLSPQDIAADAETWEKAVRKLRGRLMPPPGNPQPDQPTIAPGGTIDFYSGKLDVPANSKNMKLSFSSGAAGADTDGAAAAAGRDDLRAAGSRAARSSRATFAKAMTIRPPTTPVMPAEIIVFPMSKPLLATPKSVMPPPATVTMTPSASKTINIPAMPPVAPPSKRAQKRGIVTVCGLPRKHQPPFAPGLPSSR